MSHLADVLSFLGGFELDTRDLEERWEALEKQIGLLIENSGELQTMIDEIRKAKVRGTWESMKKSTKGEKVINLTDFLPPR
jgi:prefoldin subunit 5